MFNGIAFTGFHQTYDFSYFLSYVSLYSKILCVFFVVAWLYNKDRNIEYYEKMLVYIFVGQTIIQLVAFLNPTIRDIIFIFSRAEELYISEWGKRGLGLSGGMGWNLGLTYGLIFIFYTKAFILKKISVFSIIIGCLLFIGIFFSGRTAYFGVIVSAIYYFFSRNITWTRKTTNLFRFFALFLFTTILIYAAFFNLINTFIEQNMHVFTWAFEFFFSMEEKGSLETVSTNHLLRMWADGIRLMTLQTFFLGDGYFFNPQTGAFYHRIDVGYFRNIFYWGILGSIFIYVYQLIVLNQMLLKKEQRKKEIVFFLLFYLFVSEMKAISAGANHMTMTVCVLYALLYNRTNIQQRSHSQRRVIK